MDSVFTQEQQHLSETYAKLQSIERRAAEDLRRTLAQASKDKSDMAESLALDFTSDDMSMETYADLEAMNRIIDNLSLSSQISTEELSKVHLLLNQPYFAKVQLRFKPDEQPRDIYLGAAGITDESYRHFIVDWRSPIAETYYNQENGPTSYEAHGRTIYCELLLRRQFDIYQDKLNACFDTTVAIQDPLLLASLTRGRTAKLQAITATIQREQNRVIRHDDVAALLVSGIAGSGKTSVLLQRIAYLFYRRRDDLRPDQVCLMSPNPVFGAYVSNVLPDMGESNPQTITWNDLMQRLGMASRAACGDVSLLYSIEPAVQDMRFEQGDFRDLRIGDERVLSANQIRSAVDKFPHIPVGPRLAALVQEDLLERLHQRIKRLSKSEDIHDAVADLDLDEQIRIFGRLAQPDGDEEACMLAQEYLQDRYAPVEKMIEEADWLRFDRIGRRVLERENLSAEEWLFLKMAITGYADRDVRYVMVDEVQDYTESQLVILVRYFKSANFLLLGDENQAIRPGTASFDQMRNVFSHAKGQVSECELLTSYRSSPEITNLFCSLLPKHQRIRATSVQPEGIEPIIQEHLDDREYQTALACSVRDCSDSEDLCAVIAQDAHAAKQVSKMLGENAPIVIGSHQPIPDGGTFIIPLHLAKGLEFDRVIIPDAQEDVFGYDDLSRHRLYTAMSRATKQLIIHSRGRMTPLLR